MRKTLFTLISIIFSTGLFAEGVTIEISKNYEFDTLYVESSLNDKEMANNLMVLLGDYSVKDSIRPTDSCSSLDIKNPLISCISLNDSLGKQFKVSYFSSEKDQGSYTFTQGDIYSAADYIFSKIKGESSPLNSKLLFISQQKENNRWLYSIFTSNLQGDQVKKIYESPKTILSLSVNPVNPNIISYVSFEMIFPYPVIHNLASGERTLLSNLNGRANSVSWSKDGNDLYISMSRKDSPYNIFKLNMTTSEFSRVTSYKHDVINPYQVDQENLLVTLIHDTKPGTYLFNLKTNKFSRLPITHNYLYSSNASISGSGSLIAVVQSNGSYQLVHYPKYNEYTKDIIFENSGIESPKFIGNSSFFALTYREKYSNNNIAILNKNGEIVETMRLPNINIQELEVINKEVVYE